MDIQKFTNELRTACNLCGKNGVTIMLSYGISEATIHFARPMYLYDEVFDMHTRDTLIAIDDCCVEVYKSDRLSKPIYRFSSTADYLIDF